MLKARQKIRIRNKMMKERPTINIGKRGLTSSIVEEVIKQLRLHEMVKIKSLNLPLQDESQRALIEDLSKRTRSSIVEIRGNTLILYSSKKQQRQSAAEEQGK